jgi:hypothetical protein
MENSRKQRSAGTKPIRRLNLTAKSAISVSSDPASLQILPAIPFTLRWNADTRKMGAFRLTKICVKCITIDLNMLNLPQ